MNKHQQSIFLVEVFTDKNEPFGFIPVLLEIAIKKNMFFAGTFLTHKERKFCGKRHRDYKKIVGIAGKIEKKLKYLVVSTYIHNAKICKNHQLMISIVPVLEKMR